MASASAPTHLPTTPRLDTAIECVMVVLLTAMPAVRGGVNAWGEMVAISGGAVIAMLLAVRMMIHPGERGPRRWIVWTPVALFVALAVAQLIALPAGAVRIIAPATHALRSELLPDLPDALSKMTITFYPLGTRHDLRIVLLAVTIFATALTVYRDPLRARRLLIAITIIAAAAAVLAFAPYVTRTNKIYWLVDIGERARSGPFVNHSHFGQFMNLSIGAAIALLLMHQGRWRITLPLAAFIVLGWITIFFSWTRGGMASAALAGAFTLITFGIARRRAWPIVLAVMVLAAVALGLRQLPRDHTRLQIAQDVWGMSKEFGRTGMGLGTFEWTYTMFDRTRAPTIASHADNEYVQMLEEVGWPGVSLVLLFAAIIWWHWLRALRSGSPMAAATAMGLGYSLLAVMIHSITDFGQHLPANACLSAIACALIVNQAGGRATEPRRRAITLRVLAAIAITAVAAWVVIDAERARRGEDYFAATRRLARRLEAANWSAPQERLDQLRAYADDAVAAEPGNAHYRYWRAVYNWRIAAREFARGSNELTVMARDVVDQLNAARRLCPTYGPLYLVLGQIEQTYLGVPEGAARLDIATRLEPNDPDVWFAAGRADARRGDFDSALRKFRYALKLDDSVLTSIAALYLDELHLPQEAIRTVDDNHYCMRLLGNAMMKRPQYVELGGKTYLRGSYMLAEHVRSLAAPTPEQQWYAGMALLENEKLDESEQFFAAAVQREPSRARWRVDYAYVLMRQNKSDEAARQLQIAEQQGVEHPHLAMIKQKIAAAGKASTSPAP